MERDVAVPAGAAGCCSDHAWRGLDPDAAKQAKCQRVAQGGGRQPYRDIQSEGIGAGGNDGPPLWSEKVGGTLGGKCGRGAGRLFSGRRNRSAWLAAEWGHPSDNLGGILAVADWLSRSAAQGEPPLRMRQVLEAMIKAHEIQGCIALENSFNKVGLDHVVLVKVASTAVVCGLLGLNREQTVNAISLAWVDGQSLRTYRHAPNTGSRKSWAAGDATSRAVRLALMAKAGEMGYPSALTAKTWGFYDVSFKGLEFKFQRPYGSYVMENVLFKISYPAEFHAQTAVEAAMTLHAKLAARGLNASSIRSITIRTHEACLRIIDKKGPLSNPADRDHCIQYMVPLGRLGSRSEQLRGRNSPISIVQPLAVCALKKLADKIWPVCPYLTVPRKQISGLSPPDDGARDTTSRSLLGVDLPMCAEYAWQ